MPILGLNRRFGFIKGGNYSFRIFNAKRLESILILLATYENVDIYFTELGDLNFCNGLYVDYINIIEIDSNGFGQVNGTIDTKDMYYTYIAACNDNDGGYTLEIQYFNGNSCLSYDEMPCLITMPIVAGIVGTFWIGWMINWGLNFSLKNSLHLYLTMGLTLTTVYYLLFVFEERRLDVSDDPSPIYVARKVFRVLSEFILLSAMLMASEGWCIIRTTIPLYSIIGSFFFGAVVSIAFAVYDFVNLNTIGSIICLVIILVNFVVFILIMMYKIRLARVAIEAHLYVIAEEGIDPETTPVYKKIRLLKIVVISFMGYCISLFARSILNFFWSLPFWVMQLIYDLVALAFAGTIAVVFRMKKETVCGYMAMGDDEEQEPRVFDRSDIQRINWMQQMKSKYSAI